MKNEDIFSCPFCGNTNVEVARTNANACWICCDDETGCGAEAPSAKTRKGAIANWNRRQNRVLPATVVYDMDPEFAARPKL